MTVKTRQTGHNPVRLPLLDVIENSGAEMPGDTPSHHPSHRISCRRIRPSDLGAIADLLCEGFPTRARNYWLDGLRYITALASPGEVPRFGYVLSAGDELVGVLLLIFSGNASLQNARCNVSSWYVRPAYRAYASQLVALAIRNPTATYINISPAQHTLPIIEAQGFVKAIQGCFVGLPALSLRGGGAVISMTPDQWNKSTKMSAADECLLREHAMSGCITLWLETPSSGHPFIFRRRILRLGRLPCAMLVYCRSLEDLERFAGPIGRALMRQGLPLMFAGSDRPLHGMPGKHFPGKMPIYYRGPVKPRSGDLSYTEASVFGI
jgi:hypothetical protein